MLRFTALLTVGALLATAASAQTPDLKANRGPLRSVITLKALGAAELIEGPVVYDTVIFTQKLAFAMPGVLKTDVMSGKSDAPLLKAGTLMWGVPTKTPEDKPTWCTQRATDVSRVCIGMGTSRGVPSFYLFPVTDDAAVTGTRPAGTPQKVNAPDVEATDGVVDSGYTVTFAMVNSNSMAIERKYWYGGKALVTEKMTTMSRHDMILSTQNGEALYVRYDPATESFSAKRYATEAEALAQ